VTRECSVVVQGQKIFLPHSPVPGKIWRHTLSMAKLVHAIKKYISRGAPGQAVEGGSCGGIVGSILDNMR
jgi:hypothetical protein